MDTPAELFFRNMKPSQELTQLTKALVDKLDHLYPHIVGCRVTIGLQNHTHRSGNVPDVQIVIQVPGDTMTVNQHPDQGDASVVLHKAFSVAGQRLKEYKARKYGHVKQHGEEALPGYPGEV